MRIIFMGTPQFAADILEELANAHEVVSVFTRPDAIRGRGKSLIASDVAQVADKLGIECRKVANLRDAADVSYIQSLQVDAIVVAAYGAILPKAVLNAPKLGCFNVHASLLPRWRGAAPIERAILAGDEYAGVCIMRMEEGLDTGDYCIRREIPIDGMNAHDLTLELASLGANALITALAQIEAGKVFWTSQDDAHVTYADKIQKHELDLDAGDSAIQNALRIQASSETHPAKAKIADKDVRVLAGKALQASDLPSADLKTLSTGDVLFVQKRLFLVCAEGVLEVLSLQPAGKKPMEAKAFAAGSQAVRSGQAKWGRVDA